jgi:hypothetical protein
MPFCLFLCFYLICLWPFISFIFLKPVSSILRRSLYFILFILCIFSYIFRVLSIRFILSCPYLCHFILFCEFYFNSYSLFVSSFLSHLSFSFISLAYKFYNFTKGNILKIYSDCFSILPTSPFMNFLVYFLH